MSKNKSDLKIYHDNYRIVMCIGLIAGFFISVLVIPLSPIGSSVFDCIGRIVSFIALVIVGQYVPLIVYKIFKYLFRFIDVIFRILRGLYRLGK